MHLFHEISQFKSSFVKQTNCKSNDKDGELYKLIFTTTKVNHKKLRV